jgi:acyl-CoA reductase-like NAD-dependent aldehyde dehydrogenase
MAAQKNTGKKNTGNELDAAERNAMSDGTFAFPRVRKEPLNDARHVRNAIARFDQVRDVSDAERDEAFRRIRKAAKKHGVEMTEKRWQDLGKPSAARKSSDKPRTS